MKFLSVYRASDIEDLKADGVMGLAPIFQDGSKGDLIIDHLKNSGKISERVFSLKLLLSRDSGDSTIQLGGYDSNYIKSINEQYYFPDD